MARDKMDDRRPAVTERVDHELVGGQKMSMLVTFGVDARGGGRVREAFCADFKAGTDNHSLIVDACVLFSRCLQHGDTAEEIAAKLCQPHSIIGSIARAAARLDAERGLPTLARKP